MDAKAYADGLREFADWVESTNEGLLDEVDLSDVSVMLYATSAEKFRDYVRALGRGEKSGDESYFKVTRRFGPVVVQTYTARAAVCERRVVGTREVTRTVRDPELLEQVPLVTVTETVEEVEWVCEPSILATDEAAV